MATNTVTLAQLQSDPGFQALLAKYPNASNAFSSQYGPFQVELSQYLKSKGLSGNYSNDISDLGGNNHLTTSNGQVVLDANGSYWDLVNPLKNPAVGIVAGGITAGLALAPAADSAVTATDATATGTTAATTATSIDATQAAADDIAPDLTAQATAATLPSTVVSAGTPGGVVASTAGTAASTASTLFGLTPGQIASLVGTGIQALGQILSANANKALADFNAGVARQQAADAIMQGGLQADRFGQQVRQLIGTQRAGFASQNVDVGVGSPVAVQASTQFQGTLDEITIRNNAARTAWGYQQQATDEEMGGNAAELGGYMGAASSLVRGAGSFLANQYGFA